MNRTTFKQVLVRSGKRFDKIEPEHESEFDMYFSQVDLGSLNNKVVCDVGCGMGRWSWILLNKIAPSHLICIDFSDAIFVVS